MTIDLRKPEDFVMSVFDTNNFISMFVRGSAVYGTLTDTSDNDIGIIVDDNTEIIDQENAFNDKADTRIHGTTAYIEGLPPIDYQIIKESDFIDMIKEHHPMALEAIFLTDKKFYMLEDIEKKITDYLQYFKLDKWKLRQSFGTIANNSYAKAKKKMTVAKDLDVVCGAKSLFHSIRLLDFACQIAKDGKITDYSGSNDILQGIMQDLADGYTWKKFDRVYKPIWKEAHSKMVKLCPKPREFYKKPKTKKD